jgi:hypothetical protein
MLVKLYQWLASLSLGIWLMGGVIVLLAIGSFNGGGAESSSINDMALFAWLREAPLAWSWWLWLAIALLALLAVNTVLCSIESLRSKWQRTRFLALIAPQVMHAGFLFIVLAHLFSAYGSQKGVLQVAEGQVIGFPDGSGVAIANISGEVGPMGILTHYQAEAIDSNGSGRAVGRISPNNPLFHKGFGVYLKDVQLSPQRIALIEIHREPGAGLALAGALLFTIGNFVLLATRRNR